MFLVLTRIFATCLLLAGHVPTSAFAQAPQCEMACCRKTAHNSCHRSHTHSGLAWQGTICGSSCHSVQLGAMPVVNSVSALRSAPKPEASAVLMARAIETDGTRLVTFSLFERPPPIAIQL